MLFSQIIKQVARGLASDRAAIDINGRLVAIRYTAGGLKKAEFSTLGGRKFVAIEQNPNKSSNWAASARAGHNVVQILEKIDNAPRDRYIAVAVDQEVHFYGS